MSCISSLTKPRPVRKVSIPYATACTGDGRPHAPGHHCITVPESLTTLPHFSVSAASNAPNALPDRDPGSAPTSESFRAKSASPSAFITSSVNIFRTAGGVLAGATRPNHDDASKPGTPASSMVGNSGNNGDRAWPATASARRPVSYTHLTLPTIYSF